MFHYLRLPIAFAVLSLSFVLVGCTGEPGDGWPGTVDTTATGVVEVSNPPQGRWSPEETWRVEGVSRVRILAEQGVEDVEVLPRRAQCDLSYGPRAHRMLL